MTAAQRPGMILLCAADGMVKEVLHQGAGTEGLIRPGQPLGALVAPESFSKALDFLSALVRDDGAYDWEVTMDVGGEFLPYRLSGAMVEAGLAVAAVPADRDGDLLIEDLAKINGEHVTLLRRLLKDRATRHDPGRLFDSMTELNSELVNTQRRLAKANATLTAAVDTKNKLFGVLAHDLRTPISVISGYAEILEMMLPAEGHGRELEYVGRIRESTRYMLALIGDVLSLSAIESGHLHLDRQPTDLAWLIRHVVTLSSILAEGKGVSLSLRDSEPLEALVDAIKIEQVLTNLLGNAIKFSHAGSVISVGLRRGQGPDGQTRAAIEVTDTGIGIDPDKLDSLFHPFTKGEAGTAGEASFGLGLYICARMIEAHGGQIHVASVQGQGTTVSVLLPMED